MSGHFQMVSSVFQSDVIKERVQSDDDLRSDVYGVGAFLCGCVHLGAVCCGDRTSMAVVSSHADEKLLKSKHLRRRIKRNGKCGALAAQMTQSPHTQPLDIAL